MATSAAERQKLASNFADIDELISLASRSKQAIEATGTVDGDPPTTHPVGSTDNNAQPASEGSRAAEHDREIPVHVGPQAVDGETTTPGDQEAHQPDMHMEQSGTGKDPSNETASTTQSVKDAPTTHPAKTAAQDVLAKTAKARSLGDELLSAFGVQSTKEASEGGEAAEAADGSDGAVEAPAKSEGEEKSEDEEEKEDDSDSELGKEAADAVLATMQSASSQVDDELIVTKIAELIDRTDRLADYTSQFLDEVSEAREKNAMGGMDPEGIATMAAGEDAMGGMEGMEGMEGMGGEEDVLSQMSDEDLAQLAEIAELVDSLDEGEAEMLLAELEGGGGDLGGGGGEVAAPPMGEDMAMGGETTPDEVAESGSDMSEDVEMDDDDDDEEDFGKEAIHRLALEGLQARMKTKVASSKSKQAKQDKKARTKKQGSLDYLQEILARS